MHHKLYYKLKDTISRRNRKKGNIILWVIFIKYRFILLIEYKLYVLIQTIIAIIHNWVGDAIDVYVWWFQ